MQILQCDTSSNYMIFFTINARLHIIITVLKVVLIDKLCSNCYIFDTLYFEIRDTFFIFIIFIISTYKTYSIPNKM